MFCVWLYEPFLLQVLKSFFFFFNYYYYFRLFCSCSALVPPVPRLMAALGMLMGGPARQGIQECQNCLDKTNGAKKRKLNKTHMNKSFRDIPLRSLHRRRPPSENTWQRISLPNIRWHLNKYGCSRILSRVHAGFYWKFCPSISILFVSTTSARVKLGCNCTAVVKVYIDDACVFVFLYIYTWKMVSRLSLHLGKRLSSCGLNLLQFQRPHTPL